MAPPTKVSLRRPMKVGEKDVAEVDLSGLAELTGADILKCRREASGAKEGGEPVIYGALDDEYRLQVAAHVSGLDRAILLKLWAPDFEEVDGKVKSFLMGLD